MNHYFLFKRLVAASLLSVLLGLGTPTALAHGPDGDHAEPSAGASTLAGGARLEAKSELFELVARLQGDHLSILIDRYASNEPVLKAAVELESGALKAKAKFRAEQGDYAVDDPALLKLLATPGEHALLITIMAGDEADLLEGVLRTAAAGAAGLDHDTEYGHGKPWLPIWARWLGGAALLLLTLLVWAWRRKAKQATKFAGEQA
ncbi:hypothetical protein [Roseateles oligotrophus]|uniref:Secreted protein n=1 Tax=Roseateles oligotrophus TaxID=1769250 RepID=A0ABT2YCW5_9BURK|nr:hypothetical protein [Roseateles oligotrophus]MCV2367861.1 hypothetical protein [Roseateles oligotrophus]